MSSSDDDKVSELTAHPGPKVKVALIMSDLETEYLHILQKKSKSREGKPHESFFGHLGSRVSRENEYMVIVSDGDIQPRDVNIAKRNYDANSKKQAVNKYRNLLSSSPTFQELSESTAFDLKIVTHGISLSKSKHLKSLKLDIKGKEREKGHYLDAIREFIKNCRYRGGKMCFITFWYVFNNSLFKL